ALLAGAGALLLYLRTAAPDLTWAHHGADGGDLLAGALTRGVPHPTGYPTYQLLLAAAIRLVPAAPARVGNLLSALAAALAVALLADLTRRTLSGWPRGVAAGAGVAAGWIWATSPGLWSQAVITEVYALNALIVAALLWLAWRGREAALAGRRAAPWLAAAGLIFGLGLGNHLTLALWFPTLLIWWWGAAPARSPVAVGVPAVSPMRISGRDGGLALFAWALGLAVYAYLPWAARREPPVNWGDPGTAAGFWWLVSGSIYRRMIFGIPLADLPHRLIAWAAEAGRQLGGGPWGAGLALVGIWRLEEARAVWSRGVALGAGLLIVYAIGYDSADSDVYLIPAWGVAALWFGWGAAWLSVEIGKRRAARWGMACLVMLTVGLPATAAVRWWPQMDLSRDRAATDFLAEVGRTAGRDAIILVGGDQATFALWYDRYGLRRRPDLTPVNVHLYDFPWYQAALVRHHPALAALSAATGRLPPVEQFVREAAARWPLYRADA
ncbi:MAG: protein O-mannosyl-transferase family, partial [Anaerolineae bacterium]